MTENSGIRPPAVAGSFYPGEADALAALVDRELEAARGRDVGQGPSPPKALIAPHAGYIYSGAVAASAYARLGSGAETITRVVLIGPAHRMWLQGLAVPSHSGFATPLGVVPVDRAAVADLLQLPHVSLNDEAHAAEHSLEVHLPFLQQLLGRFSLVPLVAGQASAEVVVQVLETAWGGPETLIVVSSDLSHYRDYASAQTVDAATVRAIEALDGDAIGDDDACGRVPIRGLIRIAHDRHLEATTVDLRNSGDTAGPRDRVVGYASVLFGAAMARLDAGDRETLLRITAASIHGGIGGGRALKVDPAPYPAPLRAIRACFVTLMHQDQLRGCVGTTRARQPLVAEAAQSGWAAAFDDPRFKPLTASTFDALKIGVSVLTPPREFAASSERDVVQALRPGIDGLILRAGDRRATFLPQVWERGTSAERFVTALLRKAGIERGSWPEGTRAWRYQSESFAAPVAVIERSH